MALTDAIAEYVDLNGPWLAHVTDVSPHALIRHGLLPGRDTGRRRAHPDGFEHRTDVVYLGSPEVVLALYAPTDGGTVAYVDIRTLNPARLVPDARVFFWTDYTDHGGPIVDPASSGLTDPRSTVGVGRPYASAAAWATAELSSQQERWAELSLRVESVIAHVGPVPVHSTRPAPCRTPATAKAAA